LPVTSNTRPITPSPTGIDLTTILSYTEIQLADDLTLQRATKEALQIENPDKETVRLCSIRCPHMNEITLEDTRDALLYNRYVIDVPEDIRVRAKRALDRMLEIG